MDNITNKQLIKVEYKYLGKLIVAVVNQNKPSIFIEYFIKLTNFITLNNVLSLDTYLMEYKTSSPNLGLSKL